MEKRKKTNDEAIIEHSLEHAAEQVRPKVIVRKINHVRLWGKHVFPCKVVGIEGSRPLIVERKTTIKE